MFGLEGIYFMGATVAAAHVMELHILPHDIVWFLTLVRILYNYALYFAVIIIINISQKKRDHEYFHFNKRSYKIAEHPYTSQN